MTKYKAVGLPIVILSQEILTNQMKEADVLRTKAGISIGEISWQLIRKNHSQSNQTVIENSLPCADIDH